MFSWYTFLHPFSFSLSKALYLKWLSLDNIQWVLLFNPTQQSLSFNWFVSTIHISNVSPYSWIKIYHCAAFYSLYLFFVSFYLFLFISPPLPPFLLLSLSFFLNFLTLASHSLHLKIIYVHLKYTVPLHVQCENLITVYSQFLSPIACEMFLKIFLIAVTLGYNII